MIRQNIFQPTLLVSIGLALLAGHGSASAKPAKQPAQEAAPAATAITLDVGASQTLAAHRHISRVVVDTAGVVQVSASKTRQLVITGRTPGHTAIAVMEAGRGARYDVTVVEAGAAKAEKLRRDLAAYPGLNDIRVSATGEKIVLSGKLPSLEAHQRAVALIKGLVGDGYTDLTEVTAERTVAVDIHFYAISDTTLNGLGLNFGNFGSGFQQAVVGPNSLQSASFATPLSLGAAAPIQDAFNLFLSSSKTGGALGMLSALSEVGLSQVLAQPTLLVRSGDHAEFLAGGEIPIPVPQGGATAGAITITYKPYGVRLSVEPVVLGNGHIVLKLSPEVSELDQANRLSIQGFDIPAILRRSANTTVELGDGESFLVAGLTYASNTATIDRLPGLANLPVIGPLFRKAQTSGEKQQLVIVATPHLVRPMPAGELASVLPDHLDTPRFADLLTRADARPPSSEFGLKP